MARPAGARHRIWFDRGRLFAELEPSLGFELGDDAPEPELPPRPPLPRETKETFFGVRFVDEIGRAIPGIQVELAVDTELRDVTTKAAGVALVEGVVSSGGTVRAPDNVGLDELLDARWVPIERLKRMFGL